MTIEQIIATFRKLFDNEPTRRQLNYANDIMAGQDGHSIQSWSQRSGRTAIQIAIAVTYAIQTGKPTMMVGYGHDATKELEEIVTKAYGGEIQNLIFRTMHLFIRRNPPQYTCFHDHACYEAEEARLLSRTAFRLPENQEVR